MVNHDIEAITPMTECEISQTDGGIGILLALGAIALGAAIYIIEDYVTDK